MAGLEITKKNNIRGNLIIPSTWRWWGGGGYKVRVKDPRSGSPHRGALAPSNVLLPCKGSGNVGFSARRSPIQRLAGKPKVFSCSGLWVFPLHCLSCGPSACSGSDSILVSPAPTPSKKIKKNKKEKDYE